MKKIVILVMSVLFWGLWGCSHDMNRREIDEINFIHVLGIDYSMGEYVLTAIYSSNQGADAESGQAGKEEISQGRGQTPYEALQSLKLKNKKSVSIANTGYFLIGDKAAYNGIDVCLDFLSRDETVKMESLIFIIKDDNAEDFIKDSIENGQTVHEDLEAVKQKQEELITRNDNTLVNILNEMEVKTASVLIPYLITEENAFLLKGYAVIDQLKLADYLDMETSSAINFIKDIIRAFPIYIENKVGLSISYSKCKLKSTIKNNQIKVLIHLEFETMVKEVNTNQMIFSGKSLRELTDKQNEYIIELLKKATNYSIQHGRDILQIGRLLENQQNKRWKSLKENWNERISEVQYDFEIKSKITKSFIMGNES